MLAKRVPIQLGGMTDPFSALEQKIGVGLQLLQVLADHDYPTLISTKSTHILSSPYIDVLKRGNFYVRVSFTGAPRWLARKLEVQVPEQDERLMLIEGLADVGIPTSGRVQPLLIGAEDEAAALIQRLGDHGARHVSAEYLKWPIESSGHQSALLDRVLPQMRAQYRTLGATRIGREYVLPADSKITNLLKLRDTAHSSGLRFGFADTDLLHLNDFRACCNASDLFLRDAHFFDATILAAVKGGLETNEIRFSNALAGWHPSQSINNYLNSRSRPKLDKQKAIGEWETYLREKWNGPSIRGGPLSFWGCEMTDRRDQSGNVIYAPSDQLKAVLKGACSAEKREGEPLATS